MNILTIIPARGGSKGVPRKNLRHVGERPLIEWSIEAARGASIIQKVFVSTDDAEISQVASDAGAFVINRPQNISNDKSPMCAVVDHALSFCKMRYKEDYDYILLLQPTAPMRLSLDINQAVQIIQKSSADSVVSVYKVEDTHPARMYTIGETGNLIQYSPEPPGSLRQDLPEVYHRNGSIYLCTVDYFKTSGKLWGGNILPYIMPQDRSANIDNLQDLLIADFLMKRRQKLNLNP
jgi:CMP-N,N'-diacetyllegionaminic acid synthase